MARGFKGSFERTREWFAQRWARCGRTGLAIWGRTVWTRFSKGNGSMYAAGLTYVSMLALIPLLCCVLVIAKAVHLDRCAREQINRQIDAMITNVEKGQDDELARVTVQSAADREKRQIAAREFAREAREISDKLFERVNEFDVGTLGWIGFVLLLYTVVSSIGRVEAGFNSIWGELRNRVLWKRSLLYLGIVLSLPVLMALSMAVPLLNAAKNVIVSTMGATELTRWASDGLLWFLDSWIFRTAVTLVVASLAIALVYWVIPNRRVHFRSAVRSGVLTAVLFGGWVKVCAVAQVGIANSSALYGSFAFLPIVLAWVNVSWQIVLLGAAMTCAFERLSYGAEGTDPS